MFVELIFGAHYDSVRVDGKPLFATQSLRAFNHSPDGFAWGYGGSGPAQLALALLLYSGLDEHEAIEYHHGFLSDIVAHWPKEGGRFILDIDQWVNANRFRISLKDDYGGITLALREALDVFMRSHSRPTVPVKA